MTFRGWEIRGPVLIHTPRAPKCYAGDKARGPPVAEWDRLHGRAIDRDNHIYVGVALGFRGMPNASFRRQEGFVRECRAIGRSINISDAALVLSERPHRNVLRTHIRMCVTHIFHVLRSDRCALNGFRIRFSQWEIYACVCVQTPTHTSKCGAHSHISNIIYTLYTCSSRSGFLYIKVRNTYIYVNGVGGVGVGGRIHPICC